MAKRNAQPLLTVVWAVDKRSDAPVVLWAGDDICDGPEHAVHVRHGQARPWCSRCRGRLTAAAIAVAAVAVAIAVAIAVAVAVVVAIAVAVVAAVVAAVVVSPALAFAAAAAAAAASAALAHPDAALCPWVHLYGGDPDQDSAVHLVLPREEHARAVCKRRWPEANLVGEAHVRLLLQHEHRRVFKVRRVCVEKDSAHALFDAAGAVAGGIGEGKA